jgi:hypothetical protein
VFQFPAAGPGRVAGTEQGNLSGDQPLQGAGDGGLSGRQCQRGRGGNLLAPRRQHGRPQHSRGTQLRGARQRRDHMLESGNMQQFIDVIKSAIDGIVDCENSMLPESTRLVISQDAASIVKDRLELLIRNGWQGLALATLTLLLFFSWRYTFWVALGLPISFVGGLLITNLFGISINMISMVALLMASNIAGQK